MVDEIKATADKLAADGATRGDLKILSRVLRELRYAFKVFTPYRKQFKVTVFGSARTSREHPAYTQSVEFGRRMAAAHWMVVTGAGGGIMEGAHVGAGKEMSMGVNIMLPFEQESNAVISQDQKLVHLKYFFTRKLLFVKEVHAVALFPGGFGTQDEGFETLTLVQTGKRDPMPIVLIDEPGGTYWKAWQQFVNDELLARELVSPEDLALFKVTDDVGEAVDEIIGFYSAYNSMRVRPRPFDHPAEPRTPRRVGRATQRGIRRHHRFGTNREDDRPPARNRRRASQTSAAADHELQPQKLRTPAANDRCAEQRAGSLGLRLAVSGSLSHRARFWDTDGRTLTPDPSPAGGEGRGSARDSLL